MSLMKIIMVIMIGFIPVLTNAQTFKCTSVKFSDEVSTSEQQRWKEKALGAKMVCEFFQTDIKATISYEYKGEWRKDVCIFEKDGDIYRCDDFVLNIEKTLGFITKIIQLQYSYDNKLETTIIFERELF